MATDSRNAGYLAPQASPAVDQDAAFHDFLHDVLAGILGLPDALVRPGWQSNPPPAPDISVNWAAFYVAEQVGDFDPYVVQVPRPIEADPDADPPVEADPDFTMQQQQRGERVTLRVVHYGPACMSYAGLLRDGLDVEQNRATLKAAGIAVADVSSAVRAPEPVGAHYVDRADVTLTLDRIVRRVYPVLHFVAASGIINGNRGTSIVAANFNSSEATP